MMKKKMFFTLKLLPIILIAGFLLYWGISLFNCEVLTKKYGNEFIGLHEQTHMIDYVDYLKVLEYSKETAKVYYITNDVGGTTLDFKKVDGKWQMKEWNVAWSSTGSASDVQWPYFWVFRNLFNN